MPAPSNPDLINYSLNYRHLHYFWVVGKEGGMARAADRLGMAIQTVSAQVRELERSLGCVLLRPSGRGLQLTEAGQRAMEQADLIFQLGQQLPEIVRGAADDRHMRLAVGIADSLPKLMVHRLLEPVATSPQASSPILASLKVRLICEEGDFEDLLADLALHRLDVVLADRPAPANANLKVYTHALGAAELSWYAPARWHAQALDGFPRSLGTVPVLLPTRQAASRPLIDDWFAKMSVHPNIVGEFEDSALLATFAAAGMGVFPAATVLQDKLKTQHNVQPVHACGDVKERYFAIGTEKKVMHPLVQRLLAMQDVVS